MTPHPLQEHTHENVPHSQVPNWLQHGWIFLKQLLLDCPAVCYLWWHGKETGTADPHCGLPQQFWTEWDRLQWTVWPVSFLGSLGASSSSWDLGLSPGATPALPEVTGRSSGATQFCQFPAEISATGYNVVLQNAPVERRAAQRTLCSFITKLT